MIKMHIYIDWKDEATFFCSEAEYEVIKYINYDR